MSEKKEILGLVLSFAVALGVLGGGFWLLKKMNNPQPEKPAVQGIKNEPERTPQTDSFLEERMSFGEKILVAAEGNSPAFPNLKEEGTNAFARGNYNEAISKFESARKQNPNTPESLIYLNNAKIGKGKAYTIAVVVPINEDYRYRALEMLRGFAQAQNEVNNKGGINGVPLKLAIVNDDEDKDIAEQIAKELVKTRDDEVIGVIGHNSSRVSLAAGNIYDKGKLVFITPVSTASKLTSVDKPYIFRTNINSEIGGRVLANYMLDNLKQKKVAVFYVPQVPYSKDLKTQFERNIFSKQGEIVAEYDFSLRPDPKKSLQDANSKGAQVILLVPTNKYLRAALDVVEVKYKNYPQMTLLGDIATLYTSDTLKIAREAAVGMVLPVSWHIGESESEFTIESKKLWGASVNWATATSYDAAQAFIEALKRDRNPTRESVQKQLSDPNFSAKGASGKIKFFNGEPPERVTLVQVKKVEPSTSGTGYDFVPVKPQ